MKKYFLPIILSVALLVGYSNIVYADEKTLEVTSENKQENKEQFIEYNSKDEQKTDLLEDKSKAKSKDEQKTDLFEDKSKDKSKDEQKTHILEDEAEENFEDESDENFEDESDENVEDESDENVEDEPENSLEPEDDSSDAPTETCSIQIIYEEEYYELINLCPSENVLVSTNEYKVAVAKGDSFSKVFSGSIINSDLMEKINLPEKVQEDCKISIYVDIKGKITSKLSTD